MKPTDILRTLATRAAKGEIEGVAVAIVYADGRSSHMISDSEQLIQLLGAASVLQHELIVAASFAGDDDDELPPLGRAH